jgi:hypothetical protein
LTLDRGKYDGGIAHPTNLAGRSPGQIAAVE